MSVRALNWAFALQDLSHLQKLTLVALADACDDLGVCWPSVGMLCLKTSAGESTVHRALAQLQHKGKLTVVPRFSPEGRQRSNGYVLGMGQGPIEHPALGEGVTVTPPEGPGAGPPGCQSGTPEGPGAGPPMNRNKDPSEGTDKDDLDGCFEVWWRGVWRKDGKGAARRAYCGAVRRLVREGIAGPEDADVSTVPNAVLFLLEKRDAQRERYDFDEQPMKYRKQPSTWLNGECWGDESLVAVTEEEEDDDGGDRGL